MTKKADLFDLGAIDTAKACNTPIEYEIKHPSTGAGLGVFVKIVGVDSDVYRGRVRALADDALRRQAAGKPALADSSVDKLEEKNIDALVAATVGWRTGDEPVVIVEGEKLEFSNENARRVYKQLFRVRDQISEAINDLGNFMTA